jgi:hypothetical protein
LGWNFSAGGVVGRKSDCGPLNQPPINGELEVGLEIAAAVRRSLSSPPRGRRGDRGRLRAMPVIEKGKRRRETFKLM